MAKRLKKEDPLEGLPAWARSLAQRYYTKTVSTFLLHGAVRDHQPIVQEDGRRGFGTLRTFLAEELFGGRDHVLFYDRSSGIRAADPETQKELHRAMAAYDTVYGTDFAKALPRDPGRALQILENFLRTRLSEGRSLAVIVDFAETLVPAGDLASLSTEDRFVLATLTRWAHDPQLLAGDCSLVLLAENLAGHLAAPGPQPLRREHRALAARRGGAPGLPQGPAGRKEADQLQRRGPAGAGEDDRRALAAQPGPPAHRGAGAGRAHHARAAQGEEARDHPGRVPRPAGVHRARAHAGLGGRPRQGEGDAASGLLGPEAGAGWR